MTVSAENDPEQKRSISDVTEASNSNSLARLTLRQLRLKASELSIPLYSRKTKASLIKEIERSQSSEANQKLPSFANFWKAPTKNTSSSSLIDSQSATRVVFLPRDPEWSYVFWEISEPDRKRALARGANRLCLRLSDVTGIADGSAHPHTLQEIPVDSHSTEWYLPIPLSNRDYRVELGYRFGNSWMSLAFSSAARVPSLHPSDQILDQFVPFSLDANSIADPIQETQSGNSLEVADNSLHERLFQSATNNFRQTRIGSEVFQESDFSQASHSDSGSGLWASGRNESGIGGLAPRKRSLWLVADAELIVYGSTDPSAELSIGNEQIPLSSEGTFRLQVPFRDGDQNYPIEATSSDGSQKCNITLNFQRTTPVDNSIPRDQAKSKWF